MELGEARQAYKKAVALAIRQEYRLMKIRADLAEAQLDCSIATQALATAQVDFENAWRTDKLYGPGGTLPPPKETS